MRALTGPPAFDLNSASAEALMAQFPDVGLFAAEDVIAWRAANGPFRSLTPLIELGLRAELAEELLAHACPPEEPRAPSVAPAKSVEVGDLRPSIQPSARSAPPPRPFPSIAPSFSPEPATEPAASAAPPPPTPAPPSASVSPAPRRSRGISIALTLLAMGNAALLAGLLALRHEEHAGRAPVTAMSHEVKELRARDEAASAIQQRTEARLDDTHARVAKQDEAIARTIERVKAIEEHQRVAERDDAKRTAALAERLGKVERKVDGEVYTLAQAIDIIDAAHGHALAPIARDGGSARHGLEPASSRRPRGSP